jgi:hypothetical protein
LSATPTLLAAGEIDTNACVNPTGLTETRVVGFQSFAGWSVAQRRTLLRVCRQNVTAVSVQPLLVEPVHPRQCRQLQVIDVVPAVGIWSVDEFCFGVRWDTRSPAPRVDDRRVDEMGSKARFGRRSCRRAARRPRSDRGAALVVPPRDVEWRLRAGTVGFFGSGAGLSASVVTRLKKSWQDDHRSS